MWQIAPVPIAVARSGSVEQPIGCAESGEACCGAEWWAGRLPIAVPNARGRARRQGTAGIDVVGGLVVMVMAWVEPPEHSYVYGALLSAAGLVTFVFAVALLIAGIGLLRRARWSVPLGGVAGGIGTLLIITGFFAAAYSLLGSRVNDDTVTSLFLGCVVATALFLPSISLFVGAIKSKFRLPAYLNVSVPEGGQRPKLLELLVP